MKRYLAFVVLVLAAWSAAGEGEPRFFVERIEVRGLSSARPELVVTESRLEEGREYD